MNRSVSDSPIRLGAIEFINTLPVYLGFGVPADPELKLTYAPPSELNRAIASGELDVSPVSSAFYLRHQADLVLLEDLSVSSPGAVESVLFLTQKPLTAAPLWDPTEDIIAVPDASETSVALLAHLLSRHTGHSAQVWQARFKIYPAQNYAQALAEYGNALVIGDNALVLSHGRTVEQYFYYDLAAMWHEETGQPFVFAVWVAQKNWAQKNPIALQELNQQLCQSRDLFFANADLLEQAVQIACERCPLTPEQARHYFTQALEYRLIESHRASLDAFEAVLASLDAVSPDIVGAPA